MGRAAPDRRGGLPIPTLIRALLVLAVALPGAARAECFRLLDFETDHAGEPLEPGDDLEYAYAAWSVELRSPDPDVAPTAEVEDEARGDLAAGGLQVHVVHFEDPFCVRSIELGGFTGGQAAVVPQCFDGTALPPIRAEDPGLQTFEELCGVGTLRIEFWESDITPRWDELCIDLDFGAGRGPCGDVSAADPPPPPVFEGPEDEADASADACAGCDDDTALAWPGLILLGGVGRRGCARRRGAGEPR